MNVVDSCGYVEYFRDGENAAFFAPIIENTNELIVPSIAIYEVFKKMCIQLTLGDAELAVVQMKQAQVAELTLELALSAAKISLNLKLPMADSIIYATAKAHGATVWTQDQHFEFLPNVNFIAKPKTPNA